jgi:hypothetical protein
MASMKGQVSLEFLVYTAVFMLAFVIVIFVFSDMAKFETSNNNYIMSSIVGSKILSFATLARSMGPEFNTEFGLPANINGYSYMVIIYSTAEDKEVVVNVYDSFNTHFSSVSGDLDIANLDGNDEIVLTPGKTVYVVEGKNGLCITQEKEVCE